MAECLDIAVATPQPSVSYGQKLSQSGSAESSSTDSSAPMDLGSMNHKPAIKKPAVKTSDRKFQKITPEIKQQLMAKNACFWCRKPRHKMNQCRSYPNAQKARQ